MLQFFKELGRAFTIGVAIFLGRGLIMYLDGVTIVADEDLFLDFIYNQIYAVVLYMANAYFVSYMLNKYRNKLFEIKNLLFAALLSVGISVVAIFLLRLLIKVVVYDMPLSEFLANEKALHYWFSLTISVVVTTAFYIYYYNKSKQEHKVKVQKVIAGAASAKFESLKNQLDPHFLFNSLNVLTSLIGENPRQAEKFTTKLSKVYRYVLEQKDKDLTSLEDELQFAKSYMELLKMRFEDAITFTIPETVSNQELKIVPLSLQLLLENAVKHNVITSNKPLEIRIYEENGYLAIENNINIKSSLEKSTKVGLKNIDQRYALISRKAVEITRENEIFKVKLPLLTQEIKTMKSDYISDNNKYIRAKKRVEELKGFYGGLVAYCVVIPFLIFINYRTSWDYKWFWFPVFGWGLGIVIHAFTIFGYGRDWEERKIRQIMEEDNNH